MAAIDVRSGKRCRPMKYRYAMPTNATGMASGETSKMVNGSIPRARATPSTNRLVDVPIRVIVPPRIDA